MSNRQSHPGRVQPSPSQYGGGGGGRGLGASSYQAAPPTSLSEPCNPTPEVPSPYRAALLRQPGHGTEGERIVVRGGGGDTGGRGRGASSFQAAPPPTCSFPAVPPPAAASQLSEPCNPTPAVPSPYRIALLRKPGYGTEGERIVVTGGGGDTGRRGRGASSFQAAPPPTCSFQAAPHPASASQSDHPSVVPDPTERPPADTFSGEGSIPKRPGGGSKGSGMCIKANRFVLDLRNADVHQYEVSIQPEFTQEQTDSAISKWAIMNKLIELYGATHLGNRRLAYDGKTNLYSGGTLPSAPTEFVFKLSSDSAGKHEFTVAFTYVSKVDLLQLSEWCVRGVDDPEANKLGLQALPVILRAAKSEQYTSPGTSLLTCSDAQEDGCKLDAGIEFCRVSYQGIRPSQMGISLNIDVSGRRAFYKPLPVTDFVEKQLNINFSMRLSACDSLKIKKALEKVKVKFSCKKFTEFYTIIGVTREPANQLMMISDDNNPDKSFIQHCHDEYDSVLRHQGLPVLLAGSDEKPIHLPMEFCEITPGQRYSKKLNGEQVGKLLAALGQHPQEREKSIKQAACKIKSSGDSFLHTQYGIELPEHLLPLKARVLPSPVLQYHNTGILSRECPEMGKWNMKDKKFFNGGKVTYWTCVNFSTKIKRDFPRRFCDSLVQVCTKLGMIFKESPYLEIRSAGCKELESVLRDIHKQCVAKFNRDGLAEKHLQLLIIILPDVAGSYDTIKRICETELGIVTQCCNPRQVSCDERYLENVALKINVKVGGQNVVLLDALQQKIPLVAGFPTIIFGADVTHPQSRDYSSPSIAAVVASMDWPEISKYRGILSAQPHCQEIIQNLYNVVENSQGEVVPVGMIRELLLEFHKSTKCKPERIIFYRDGVSESQFREVLDFEMEAIKQACQSIEVGYEPKVTFVVVQKRHRTRLFPAENAKSYEMDKSHNILPGTVVDTSICHPTQFDFYLKGHAATRGTARPMHYHVLHDDNNCSADDLQTLTYNLCYTYAKCTRSVNLVTPVYYAHLAASRARCYMERGETSETGSTSRNESETGSTSRNESVKFRPLPLMKENVKGTMFFC